MISSVEILALDRLWLLAGILLAVVLLQRSQNIERRIRSKFINNAGTTTNHLPRPRIASLLFLSILFLLLLSTLKISTGSETIKIEREGREIFIAVDVSRSMLANDIVPSRLTAAKRKVLDLLNQIEQKRNGDRVALVVFAGASFLFCPPTADYGVFRTFVRELSPQLISSQGSNIDGAINTVMESVRSISPIKEGVGTESLSAAPALAPFLVMLTDGEDPSLTPEVSGSYRAAFKESGMVLIGVGTEEGSAITLPDGRLLRDLRGEVVVSKLEEAKLQGLAVSLSGVYQRISLDNSDINTVLQSIAKGDSGDSLSSSGQVELKQYYEISHLLVWSSIVALTLMFLLSSTIRRSVLQWFVFLLATMVLAYSPSTSMAETELPSKSEDSAGAAGLYSAYNSYKKGDYSEATERFRAFLESEPADSKVWLSLGNSLFRTEDSKEAENAYKKANESSATDGSLSDARRVKIQFDSAFNAGNSALQSREFKRAISWYDKALKVVPDEERATFNREIARKLLEEEQSEQDSSESEDQEQQESEDQEEGDSEQSEQEGKSGKEGENTPEQSEGTEESGQSSEEEGQSPFSNDSQAEGREPEEQQTPQQQQGTEEQQEAADAEAKRWLNSLSDSPLIYGRQERGGPNLAQDW